MRYCTPAAVCVAFTTPKCCDRYMKHQYSASFFATQAWFSQRVPRLVGRAMHPGFHPLRPSRAAGTPVTPETRRHQFIDQ